ncbi:ribonuclease H-like domain-containing protein [Tanacetum coccineum]
MMSEDSRAPGNVGNTRSRGNQNNGQGVNNQRKVICYNCREEGHVARQCKEPKRPKDSLWHQDKAMLLQAKEKGAVLDAEAEAFLADVECTVPLAEPLALSTTNMFQVSHEDAYDSDVDDEPNAAAAFMANLSSSSSQINEYLATKDSQDVPTEASPDPPSAIPPSAAYMLNTLSELTTQVEGHRKVKLENDQVILARNKQNAELKQETESLKTTLRNKEATIAHLTCETKTVLSEKKTLEDKWRHRLLQPGHARVTVHDSDETLLETEVSRMKMSQKPGHVKPIDYAKLNALYDQFVPQKELS